MSDLAIFGGNPAVVEKPPHNPWPIINEDDRAAVLAQLDESISIYDNGGIFKKFESKFSKLHRRKHALLFNSGTAALHSAYFSLGLKPGEIVIAPSYTFPASVTPIFSLGGIPKLCDIGTDGNICFESLTRINLQGVKALVITHIWGIPCDILKISQFCKEHRIFLIEDCSHAHGSRFDNTLVGSFGDIAVWSLQGQKTISGGEGGILLTNADLLYERALLFGHYNKRCYQEIESTHNFSEFRGTGFGLKMRAHPLAIALADSQLSRLEQFLNCRQFYADKFHRLLEQFDFIETPDLSQKFCNFYRLSFVIKNDSKVKVDLFHEALIAEGACEFDRLGSTMPLSRLALFKRPWEVYPIYQKSSYPGADNDDLRVADQYYINSIRLPIWSDRSWDHLADQYLSCLLYTSPSPRDRG